MQGHQRIKPIINHVSDAQALGESAFASRARNLGTSVNVVRIEAGNFFNRHNIQQPVLAALSHARARFGDDERVLRSESLHYLA